MMTDNTWWDKKRYSLQTPVNWKSIWPFKSSKWMDTVSITNGRLNAGYVLLVWGIHWDLYARTYLVMCLEVGEAHFVQVTMICSSFAISPFSLDSSAPCTSRPTPFHPSPSPFPFIHTCTFIYLFLSPSLSIYLPFHPLSSPSIYPPSVRFLVNPD